MVTRGGGSFRLTSTILRTVYTSHALRTLEILLALSRGLLGSLGLSWVAWRGKKFLHVVCAEGRLAWLTGSMPDRQEKKNQN